VSGIPLPEGLTLTFYRARAPRPWYGWCAQSGLQAGREYCDPRLPPESAFRLPQTKDFYEVDAAGKPVAREDTGELRRQNNLLLRRDDFAACPVRDISPLDMLDFCEWAGCDLPSEYEWERAGRADKDWLYAMGGEWVPAKQKSFIAWADNTDCDMGPMPVDDERVRQGDGPFGLRHQNGNVFELTRTFMATHPRVDPAPPAPSGTGSTLIAKGGAFGSGWQELALSTRVGHFGEKGELSLVFPNRADSLGFRIARHSQRGRDLLRHSMMRVLYEFGRGNWLRFPTQYDMRRMAGVEQVHIAPTAPEPYVFVRKQAKAIAFVPIFYTDFRDDILKNADYKNGKADMGRADDALLGILRTDVPLWGGVALSKQDAEKLRQERETYRKLHEEWAKLPKRKQENIEEPQPTAPEPDEWEKRTEKNEAKCRLFRGGEVPPGEYHVFYWHGFLALANKARLMPPVAIFEIDPKTDILKKHRRKPKHEAPVSEFELDAARDAMRLHFFVEEKPKAGRVDLPPGIIGNEPSEWALAEVSPKYWRRKLKDGQMWEFQVTLPVAKGALAEGIWEKDPVRPADAAGDAEEAGAGDADEDGDDADKDASKGAENGADKETEKDAKDK
jgi:hypothetical protein